ncbi:MAG: hypothetical protein HFH68_13350 [Lachnospiraceae bacterium]|nr:hypothetical protein [Lachnospiraceae bacterium]
MEKDVKRCKKYIGNTLNIMYTIISPRDKGLITKRQMASKTLWGKEKIWARK